MGLHLIQWVGGKGQQLDQLLRLIPHTHTFVEPYGGGASILLNRDRSEVEVYNDLNNDLVNLWRVVRDPALAGRLQAQLDATLFAREEFIHAIDVLRTPPRDPVERAWALVVVQNLGVSGKAQTHSPGNWSRSFQDSKNTEKWWRRVDALRTIHERFKYVQVDNRDALVCMEYWDSPNTAFYLDPPYVLNTRQNTKYYTFEMSDEEHQKMVACILSLRGAVVLSGYEHPLYEPLTSAGWTTTEYSVMASSVVTDEGKPRRTEVAWRNPRAVELSESTLF